MRLSLLSRQEDAHEDAVWSCAWATSDLLVTGDRDPNDFFDACWSGLCMQMSVRRCI